MNKKRACYFNGSSEDISSQNLFVERDRGIIEETSPNTSPTFENNGGIITDNEYEIKSEMNLVEENKKIRQKFIHSDDNHS